MKSTDMVTAQRWFSEGERVSYDPESQRITSTDDGLRVFRRIVPATDGALWTTFLPGFPDGSYGWSKVDQQPELGASSPKLFVEYVGQGDSDKPDDYAYSTYERADLVEAHWRDLGVESTVVAAFDYSSLVVLELLSRQLDRLKGGHEPTTRIEGVLLANGGLFADGHTHPRLTTPLLKTPFGKTGTWFAQRSRFVFDKMMKDLWSKEYGVTDDELSEVFDAITRRNGAAFMSNAARFVDEHKRNAKRWDLRRLFFALQDSVAFRLVGSEGDQFESDQIVKARERLDEHGIDIRMLPGGHMTTSEYPDALARLIGALVE